jgi:hypothetical protein
LKRFKLTVKSKGNQSPETIKGLLKSKLNPTEIKVGKNTFKSLKNGKVLIETNSKEEIEALEKDINAKCGEKLSQFIRRKYRILLNRHLKNAPNRRPFKCPVHSCRGLEL